jgi:hypothetical protein
MVLGMLQRSYLRIGMASELKSSANFVGLRSISGMGVCM